MDASIIIFLILIASMFISISLLGFYLVKIFEKQSESISSVFKDISEHNYRSTEMLLDAVMSRNGQEFASVRVNKELIAHPPIQEVPPQNSFRIPSPVPQMPDFKDSELFN